MKQGDMHVKHCPMDWFMSWFMSLDIDPFLSKVLPIFILSMGVNLGSKYFYQVFFIDL